MGNYTVIYELSVEKLQAKNQLIAAPNFVWYKHNTNAHYSNLIWRVKHRELDCLVSREKALKLHNTGPF